MAQNALAGTLFSIQEYSDNPFMMTVTCPWGNTFHLYDISIDDTKNDANDNNNEPVSSHKMVNLHRDGATYGSHRMAVRGQPGIRAVEIACRKGSADKIQQFYETYLGCSTVKQTTESSDTIAVAVSVGPGVQLLFVENDQVTDQDFERMIGVHICIYISNFQSMYQTLQKQNLIWTNPRFTHLDSCDTWEEAFASRTFRFKDVLDVETGEKVLELEHETRPMMHGQFMKVPKYIPN